jgi:dihydroxyacetone kinase
MFDHFVNFSEDSVRDNLRGLALSRQRVQLLPDHNVTLYDGRDSSTVRSRFALISGGGSGHEPFAAGLVGPGGLDAAVAGHIFAAPSSASILAAIRCFSVRIPFHDFRHSRLIRISRSDRTIDGNRNSSACA